MVNISNVRRKAIIREIKEYSKYDRNYSPNEWNAYVDYLKDNKHFKNSIMSFDYYYFPKMVLQYFYCHVDNEGELKRFNIVKDQDPYIQNHAYLYQRTNRDFIHYLVYRDQQTFFIDFDNTIHVNESLSKSKREYIKNYRFKDDIVICSAKSINGIKPILQELNLEDNYSICLNGALIYKGNKIVSKTTLGNEAKQLMEEVRKANLDGFAYTSESMHLYKNIDEFDDINKDIMINHPEYQYVKEGMDYNNLIGVGFFIKENDTEKEMIVDEIVNKFNNLYAVRTRKNFYEIMNKNSNRVKAARAICNMLNKYYRCTVGIGDSMADYGLLCMTGHSYVVSSASSKLKKMKFKTVLEDKQLDVVRVLKKYEDRETVLR